MNRIIFLVLAISMVKPSFAQKTDTFLNQFQLGDSLKDKNLIDQYHDYDFSSLWTKTENRFIYGIIGKDHQRLYIKLLTVQQNPSNPLEYIVQGKSMVKGNICDFSGFIRIKTVKEITELHFGVDDKHKNKKIKAQGITVAEYEFRENEEQHHSGLFKGQVYSRWYLNKKNRIRYDNINFMSDSYSNNAFIGVWQSYNTKKEKICNWGNYRVPQANEDFDIGTAEFMVSQKYVSKGWLSIILERQMPNNAIIREKPIKKPKAWWEE